MRRRGRGGRACRQPHSEFRIAVVLPWVTEEASRTRFPPWLPHFVASARYSAMLIDYLLVHEGPLAAKELPAPARTPNVHFIDVGPGGIAARIARGLGGKLSLPEANVTSLAKLLRFMLGKWPRLVAEYKPAFGTIFADCLINYTHWGYSDLDIILGHVSRFIERSELLEHHIVTYSFGDSDAVYLRGQWTIHQNLPNVNALWMGCEHLSHGLQQEIHSKVAWVRQNEAAGRSNYHQRFLSAEGCYSHRAMHTKGIKIKVATKQAAGLALRESAREVAYVVNGAVWICGQPLPLPQPPQLRTAARSTMMEPDLAALDAASTLPCDMALPGIQTSVGEPRQVETSSEGCGGWMPAEYRVCAPNLKGYPRQTVLRRSGAFYTQSYEDSPSIVAEGGRCRQVAFFHMQEWKKRWQDGQSHINQAARYDTFRLTQDGIEPLSIPL